METPPHGRADLYVPPIPIEMAASERRRVIATAARFVETAVKRDHAEQAYELVGPNLRNGTTLANWRDGELLLPAGLIALALLVPATLVVFERVRSRGARRAYERSL